jgi:hypothetical protein
MPKQLTPAEANFIAVYLRHNFPWLGTDDSSEIPYPSGADAIEQLESVYRTLEEVSADV